MSYNCTVNVVCSCLSEESHGPVLVYSGGGGGWTFLLSSAELTRLLCCALCLMMTCPKCSKFVLGEVIGTDILGSRFILGGRTVCSFCIIRTDDLVVFISGTDDLVVFISRTDYLVVFISRTDDHSYL